MDAGSALCGKGLSKPQPRSRSVHVPAGSQLGSELQAGTGGGGGALSARAERKCCDARSFGWLRAEPVREVQERQHCRVRTGRMVRDEHVARASRPEV